MLPKFTLGMACYNDSKGVRSTLMDFRNNHPEHVAHTEVIVVDNNPHSKQGKETFEWLNSWMKGFQSCHYHAMPEPRGTTLPRDKVFLMATAPLVMCVDSHIEIKPGAITKLMELSASDPDCKDLWQGPILYDDNTILGTHFHPVWRSAMYGTWEIDKAGMESGAPFDIPGQGLGLFACHKHAWIPLHPAFRGFGGEEIMLHTLWKKEGRRTLCCPWLQWNHEFRGGATPYPNNLHERVRNYLIWCDVLSRDPMDVYRHLCALDVDQYGNPITNLIQHLVDEHGIAQNQLEGKPQELLEGIHKALKLSQGEWEKLAVDPINILDPRVAHSNEFPVIRQEQPPAGVSIEEIYSFVKSLPRDMNEHADKMREYASKCRHITEFTKRRESTAVFLAAQPTVLMSYTLEPDYLIKTLHETLSQQAETTRALADNGITPPKTCEKFSTFRKTALEADPIEETELLYINWLMDGDELFKVLEKHGERVRKYIIIPGTAAFAMKAEGSDNPGLYQGWFKWQEKHPEWKRVYHANNQYGLTVFSRLFSEPELAFGPGTMLKMILASLHIHPESNCDCNAKSATMDDWGVEGCEKNFDTIVGWMRTNEVKWNWFDKVRAGTNALFNGVAIKLNPLDPYPGLVKLAIERARHQ